MTEKNPNTIPTLTLNPASMAQDQAVLEETAQAIEAIPQPGANAAAQAAGEAVEQLDANLSPEEKKAIEDFIGQIDVNNPDHVLLFGAEAQKKIADFSDSALATVRTKDTGEVGDMLVKLVSEIKGFNESAEEPKGIGRLF